jgi:hypothetical protein
MTRRIPLGRAAVTERNSRAGLFTERKSALLWQYHQVPWTAGLSTNPETLRQLGQEGWELAGIDYAFAYFKREIPEESDDAPQADDSAAYSLLLAYAECMAGNAEREGPQSSRKGIMTAEYKQVRWIADYAAKNLETIRELSKDGWKLLAIDSTYAYFERTVDASSVTA